MTDEQLVTWLCPLCRKPVHGDRPHVRALEGEYVDGREELDAVGRQAVLFHVGHFAPRIRGKAYVLERYEGEPSGEAPASLLERIRTAYDALGEGTLEPLVALMDERIEWHGRRSVLQFWRPPPR